MADVKRFGQRRSLTVIVMPMVVVVVRWQDPANAPGLAFHALSFGRGSLGGIPGILELPSIHHCLIVVKVKF